MDVGAQEWVARAISASGRVQAGPLEIVKERTWP